MPDELKNQGPQSPGQQPLQTGAPRPGQQPPADAWGPPQPNYGQASKGFPPQQNFAPQQPGFGQPPQGFALGQQHGYPPQPQPYGRQQPQPGQSYPPQNQSYPPQAGSQSFPPPQQQPGTWSPPAQGLNFGAPPPAQYGMQPQGFRPNAFPAKASGISGKMIAAVVGGVVLVGGAVAAMSGSSSPNRSSNGGSTYNTSSSPNADDSSPSANTRDSGAAISGPPVINNLGTREPRVCSKVTHVPNAEEAAALFQCGRESRTNWDVSLWQDVRVQIGKSRPYESKSDTIYTTADTDARVYPISGTVIRYFCSSTSGPCRVTPNSGDGVCYKTTLGDYQCDLQLEHPGLLQDGDRPTTY